MTGWRTVIFGALITMLGGIQAADLATIIPGAYTNIAMAVIGVVIMVLRMITKTPVGTPQAE